MCRHRDELDDACLSHASDSVVFCGTSTTGAFFDGELRLIGASGAPVLPREVDDWKCIWLTHKLGRQSAGKGSPVARLRLLARRWVLLLLQGFLDAVRAMCAERCRPRSALACAGSESSVTQCPMSTGDDVFFAPEESVTLSCAGVGDPIGKPV